MLLQVRIGCAAMLVSVLLAAQASAQLPVVPEASGTPQQPTLTNEQIRDILMLRALQSRGSRGNVKRGVPQFVPYGNPWFMGIPMLPSQNAQQAAGDSPDPKRAARAERLRQAREEAVAKREEAVKARAKARAAAAAKAKPKPKVRKDDPA